VRPFLKKTKDKKDGDWLKEHRKKLERSVHSEISVNLRIKVNTGSNELKQQNLLGEVVQACNPRYLESRGRGRRMENLKPAWVNATMKSCLKNKSSSGLGPWLK
jgi:hypothetical protein